MIHMFELSTSGLIAFGACQHVLTLKDQLFPQLSPAILAPFLH